MTLTILWKGHQKTLENMPLRLERQGRSDCRLFSSRIIWMNFRVTRNWDSEHKHNCYYRVLLHARNDVLVYSLNLPMFNVPLHASPHTSPRSFDICFTVVCKVRNFSLCEQRTFVKVLYLMKWNELMKFMYNEMIWWKVKVGYLQFTPRKLLQPFAFLRQKKKLALHSLW